jgi:hypothetical protein
MARRLNLSPPLQLDLIWRLRMEATELVRQASFSMPSQVRHALRVKTKVPPATSRMVFNRGAPVLGMRAEQEVRAEDVSVDLSASKRISILRIIKRRYVAHTKLLDIVNMKKTASSLMGLKNYVLDNMVLNTRLNCAKTIIAQTVRETLVVVDLDPDANSFTMSNACKLLRKSFG